MRLRTIRISMKMGGFTNQIAEGTIQSFAVDKSKDEEATINICPQCGKEPKWHGGYDCECGKHYGHWSALKKVIKSTGEPVIKTKYTTDKEDVIANISVMDLDEFKKGYADAIASEYGINVKDETSALNLYRLIVATQKLNHVVVITFKDTYEERIALLTINLSGRIVLREIIPKNLVHIKETLKVDLSKITESEIQEAEQLIKTLPKATEETFKVKDYRTQLVSHAIEEEEKVLDLKVIIEQAKKKKKEVVANAQT